MMAWVLLSACQFCLPGFSQDAASQGDLDPETIGKLILQLHAEKSRERQRAKRQLVEAGAAAIKPLVEAIQVDDRDRQMREMAVLAVLAISRDKDIADRARESMRALTRSDNSTVAGLAITTLRRLGSSMEQSAIRELTELGARFDGGTNATSNRNEKRYYTVIFGRDFKGQASDLSLLLWIENPTNITVIGPKFNDQVIEAVAQHPTISYLRFQDASLTDDGLKPLLQMSRLGTLEFLYCDIGDESLATLSQLRNMRIIRLYGTEVTEQAADEMRDAVSFWVDYHYGAFMGVNFDRDNDELIITRVVPGSGAEQAGIRSGDVLVQFEDKQIKRPRDFNGTISRNRPGDEVTVVIRRDGVLETKAVTLGKFPDRY